MKEMEEGRNTETNTQNKEETPPETVLLQEFKGANLNRDFPLQLFSN